MISRLSRIQIPVNIDFQNYLSISLIFFLFSWQMFSRILSRNFQHIFTVFGENLFLEFYYQISLYFERLCGKCIPEFSIFGLSGTWASEFYLNSRILPPFFGLSGKCISNFYLYFRYIWLMDFRSLSPFFLYFQRFIIWNTFWLSLSKYTKEWR